jgi:hypothetical protein
MDVLETFGMKVKKARLQRIIKEELSRVLQEQGAILPGDDRSHWSDQSDKYPSWFDDEFDLWWYERLAGAGKEYVPGDPIGMGDPHYGQDDTKKFAWMAFKMWLDKPNKAPPVAKTPNGGKGHAMASDLTGGFGPNSQRHYGDSQWGIDGYLNQYSAGNPQHSNPNQDWYKKTSGYEDIIAEIIRRLT